VHPGGADPSRIGFPHDLMGRREAEVVVGMPLSERTPMSGPGWQGPAPRYIAPSRTGPFTVLAYTREDG